MQFGAKLFESPTGSKHLCKLYNKIWFQLGVLTQICLERRYIYPDMSGEKIYLSRYIWSEDIFTQICLERRYIYTDMSGEKIIYLTRYDW